MKWFQLDSDAPNDPKLKALFRHGVAPNSGQSAAGALFLLWCYIANHGKGEPGLGVRSDGTALSCDEMASECLFDDVDQLRAFLDYIADRGHIHPGVWRDKGLVFLPAMWSRTTEYYRQKNRAISGFTVHQQVVDALLSGRQLERAQPDRVPTTLRNLIYARDEFQCRYCGLDMRQLPKVRCLDYIVPVVQGGRGTEANLVTSCKRCSAKKLSKTPDQAGLTLRHAPSTPRAPSPTTKPEPQPTKPTEEYTEGHDLLDGHGPNQVDAVIRLWNTLRKPGPQITHPVSEKRRREIHGVLRGFPNLSDWRKVITYINDQRWCNAPGTGERPNFRMHIDTLLRPGRFASYLEQATEDARSTGLHGRDPARGTTGARPGIFAEALGRKKTS